LRVGPPDKDSGHSRIQSISRTVSGRWGGCGDRASVLSLGESPHSARGPGGPTRPGPFDRRGRRGRLRRCGPVARGARCPDSQPFAYRRIRN